MKGAAPVASPRAATVLTAAVLALLVLLAYVPSVDNGFVSYDDGVYIVDNPWVRGGLSPEGLRWAFLSTRANNWHPLAWLSHMADVSLFGLWPGGHHLTGVILHGATAVAVMLVLRAATGALLPAALAAALFALHPLRVESVAWAAERKDLLAGFMWVLALAAYVRHARRPASALPALVLLAQTAALLAKPTAVTLPFALLVFDWWPLGRLRFGPNVGAGIPVRRLLLEKIPLFTASALSAAVTLWVQGLGGATTALPPLSWETRLSNAAVSSVRYLGNTVWPAQLSFLYPHPGAPWPAAATAAAAALLAAIGVAAFLARRRAPAVVAGWLWFLGTLLPMIGLVQVGWQARADRYTYLPSLGLAVALVWGVLRFSRSRAGRTFAVAAALLACLALAALTNRQVRVWRDDRTLFGHAVRVDPGNWVARTNYGAALAGEGRFEEAVGHYLAALDRRPGNAQALHNLGVALHRLGNREAALEYLYAAVEVAPWFPEAHYNLGLLLADLGRAAESEKHLRQAERLRR